MVLGQIHSVYRQEGNHGLVLDQHGNVSIKEQPDIQCKEAVRGKKKIVPGVVCLLSDDGILAVDVIVSLPRK